MPTDAPDAVQQLIAKWRTEADKRLSDDKARCNPFFQGTAAARKNLAEDLAHLHKTVLLPAIEALDGIMEYRAHRSTCEIDQTDVCTCGMKQAADYARKILAAWDAPAGGEGTAK